MKLTKIEIFSNNLKVVLSISKDQTTRLNDEELKDKIKNILGSRFFECVMSNLT